jgi:signal transduction histidine kinase
MRCQEVDLVAIAKNVVDQMQDAYFATSGEKIKGDFNKVALGNFDPMWIEQVITNLLQNALKYGKGMNVEVQIKDSDDWLILTVKDNGMGISVDDQKKIFERYEHAISQSEVSGMGLGLFISDQIIQAHKGKLSVSSQLGEGATFKLEIP